MKRSLFSVLVLGLVLAFLYVPIIMVAVYGFVPDGTSMSFFGPGVLRRCEAPKGAVPAKGFETAWKAYRKLGTTTNAQESAWFARVPKKDDGTPADYSPDVTVGDIRLSPVGKDGHPFVFLVVGSGLMGRQIVPLSPVGCRASDRELELEGAVYQLWNALTPVADFTAASWTIGRAEPSLVQRVAEAVESANPGEVTSGSSAQAKYELHFVALWPSRFLGLSSKWYEKIFSSDPKVKAELKDLLGSFWLSLIIAALATLISCVIGTTSALALHRWRDRLQSVHHALVYTPLIMPDILIGISLLMLFVAVKVDCGFWTILLAHVTFCVSYVVMTILARLQDFDDRIVEAAYDLGAGPLYTFFKVELPILLPGIVAGGLLSFTLSIDDVVITSFVNGAGTNTFPTYVSSMTKHSRNLPSVFALSTLMLLFTCLLVGVSKLLTARRWNRRR